MRRMLAAMVALAAASGAAQAAGDPAKGEAVFKKCMACHAVGPTAKNKVGPELNGIVGRKVGVAPDYAYSDNLKEYAADGKAWDAASLATYLENPKSVLPKGKMAFVGLKKPEERDDVIAYLSQFNEDGSKK